MLWATTGRSSGEHPGRAGPVLDGHPGGGCATAVRRPSSAGWASGTGAGRPRAAQDHGRLVAKLPRCPRCHRKVRPVTGNATADRQRRRQTQVGKPLRYSPTTGLVQKCFDAPTTDWYAQRASREGASTGGAAAPRSAGSGETTGLDLLSLRCFQAVARHQHISRRGVQGRPRRQPLALAASCTVIPARGGPGRP